MPTYSYVCKKCETETQVYHSMTASPRVKCSACGSARTYRKLGIGSGIIFKGSGFYETDYKNKGGKPEKAAKGGGEGSKESASGKKESTPKTEGKKTAGDSKGGPKSDSAA